MSSSTTTDTQIEIHYERRKALFTLRDSTTYELLEADVLTYYGVKPAPGSLYDVVVVDIEDGEGILNHFKYRFCIYLEFFQNSVFFKKKLNLFFQQNQLKIFILNSFIF